MSLSQFFSIALIVYLMILFGSSAITITLVHLVLSVRKSRFATEGSCLGGVSVFLGMQYLLGITNRYLTLSILVVVVLWLSFESINQSDGHTEFMTLVEFEESNQQIQDDILCYFDGKQYIAIAGVRIKSVPDPQHRDSTNRSDETLHWLNPLQQYCQVHNTTFYVEALLEDGISTIFIKTKCYDRNIPSAVSKAYEARLLGETYLSRVGHDYEVLSRNALYQQSGHTEAVQVLVKHEDDILHSETGFIGGLLVEKLSDNVSCNMGDLLDNLSRHHFTGKILIGFHSGKLPKLSHEVSQPNDNPRQQSRIPHRIEDHKLRKTYRQMAEIEACEETGCFNIGMILLAKGDSIDDTQHERRVAATSLEGIWTGTRTKNITSGYLKRLLKHDVSHLRVGSNSIISGARLSALLELKPIPGVSTRVIPPAFAQSASVSFNKNGITLGQIMNEGKSTSQVYKIDLESLCLHTGIYGNPGSGKTNTAIHLVYQASKREIPFLAIIPAKTEWRVLLEHIPDLRIFTAGDESTSPFRFNFFDVPLGVPIQTHINNITTCFIAHWPSEGILAEHITKIFRRAYSRAGWKPLANKRGRPILLSDLRLAMMEVAEELAYGPRLKQDFIGALVARVESLLEDEILSAMLNTPKGLDIPTLLNNRTILELRHLPESQKALITSLLSVSIAEYLEAKNTHTNQGIHNLLILEEAHHVLKQVGMGNNLNEFHSAQQQAIDNLVQLFRESRGLGLGIIIIDQLPGSLSISAVKLPGNIIIHSIKDIRERMLVGGQANLTEEQIKYIGSMHCGECVIHQGFATQPVNVKVYRAFPEQNQSKPLATNSHIKDKMSAFHEEYANIYEQDSAESDRVRPNLTLLMNLKSSVSSTNFLNVYKEKLRKDLDNAQAYVRNLVKRFVSNPKEIKLYFEILLEYIEKELMLSSQNSTRAFQQKEEGFSLG